MPAILIVDDDPGCVNVLKRYLGQLGHEVVTAASGEEALERLKDEQSQVVLLDIAMPNGLDGIATLKQILENHPGTKVIMVSGLVDQNKSFGTAIGLGAYGYIHKPYNLNTVRTAINAVMLT